MRIMWLSNSSWSPSGYGQQTRIITERLQAMGHQMAILAYYGLEGGIININGITVFPKGGHPYGNDVVVPHSQVFQAQMMISFMDTWVMNPEEYPMGFRWIPWYPVDHDPIPDIVRNKIALAHRRIASSKHAVKTSHEAGLDCYYIPGSCETKLFKPGDKTEARKKLGMPLDRWIVGTVAMNKGNPSRKNFVEMLTAFANFKKSHADALYVLQTARGERMADVVNLPELARLLGLEEGKDYTICNPYQNQIGYPPDYLATLYQAMDCHMLVSAGEGLGLPLMEAAACGTPNITGDWTANSEYYFAGQLIDKSDAEPFYTALASYQFHPHIRAIEHALAYEYKYPTNMSNAVLRVQTEYDADVVAETMWKPILAEIEPTLDIHWRKPPVEVVHKVMEVSQ